MVRLRGVIPVALAVGGQVEAFSEHVGWAPAKQTPDALEKEMGIVAAPVQTASPARFGELKLKRQLGFDVIEANTCGYINGDPDGGVTCNAALGSECITEDGAQAVGCCATEDCNIWTACLDRTDSRATATANMDRTRYCSDSSSAFCAIYEYANEGDIEGYTMHLCDSTRTTYSFFQTPRGFIAETSSTTSRRTRTSSDSSSETSASATSFWTPSPDDDNGGGGAPVGAIVGGVIGGIAVLAVIGVALFFLLRKKRGGPGHQPVPQQAPGTPGVMPGGPNPYPQSPNPQMYGPVPTGVPSMYMAGPPPPQNLTPDNAAGGITQQGYYYPPQDPRSSMMKPASPVSTMGYAPPPSTSPAMTYSDTPSLQPQHTGYSQQSHVPVAGYPPHVMQQQQQQQHQQHQQHMAPPAAAAAPAPVELPTTKPDGELRELA